MSQQQQQRGRVRKITDRAAPVIEPRSVQVQLPSRRTPIQQPMQRPVQQRPYEPPVLIQFLGLGTLFGERLIRLLYGTMLVWLNLGAIYAIFNITELLGRLRVEVWNGAVIVLTMLFVTLVLNLLWRAFCEGMVMRHRIYRMLEDWEEERYQG